MMDLIWTLVCHLSGSSAVAAGDAERLAQLHAGAASWRHLLDDTGNESSTKTEGRCVYVCVCVHVRVCLCACVRVRTCLSALTLSTEIRALGCEKMHHHLAHLSLTH